MKTIQEIIDNGSWQRPNSYMGPDHENTFSIGVGQTRDSDNMAKSNFVTALEILGGESKHVEIIRDSHWGCGWVEHIRVNKNAPQKILEAACQIVNALEDYPLLDNCNYFEMKNDEIQEYSRDCLSEAAEFLAKNTDLPEELIEKVAVAVAYEIIYESEAYSGEIWFNESYVQKIIEQKENSCTGSEVLEKIIQLNFEN